MKIKRYIEVLAMVSSHGTDLKVLEDKIMKKYGVSRIMAWYYIDKLRKEDLIVRKRYYKRGPIYVKPTAEAKQIILEIVKAWRLE